MKIELPSATIDACVPEQCGLADKERECQIELSDLIKDLKSHGLQISISRNESDYWPTNKQLRKYMSSKEPFWCPRSLDPNELEFIYNDDTDTFVIIPNNDLKSQHYNLQILADIHGEEAGVLATKVMLWNLKNSGV